MQFGIGVSAHIKNWEFIQYAESLGYDRAWVGERKVLADFAKYVMPAFR